MRYAIIDVETTGGRPKESKITEVAIFIHDGTQVVEQFCTFINPELEIPSFIVRLTGISDEMVKSAPKFYEVAKKIIEITEGCVFVAHNASFDYGMFRAEFKSLGFDYRRDQICTVRTAKYLLPGHESYSLGKLCRSLNIDVQNRHRAIGDTEATAKLFDILLQQSNYDLSGFLQDEIDTKVLNPNIDLDSIDELPSKVGIYKLFNEDNQLIYIGKSKNIKKRVDQHLRNFSTGKSDEMRKAICKAEYIVTGSELIALLLESKLIKQHNPKYNRQLRKSRFSHGLFKYDDQNGYTCLYVKTLNKSLEIPLTTFSSAAEGNKTLHAITDKYGLCQKLNGLYKSINSCFRYQTKECRGACIAAENSDVYNKRVQEALAKMEFINDNFIIIDKGREKPEKSVVWIENGSFAGFGYVPFRVMRKEPKEWLHFLDRQIEDKDDRSIISLYLRKTEDAQIVLLD